jgi:hypothetical protein
MSTEKDWTATTVREGLEKAVRLLANIRGSEIPGREPKSKILTELRGVLEKDSNPAKSYPAEKPEVSTTG